MSRRPFRLPTDGPPFLELASLGRSGPPGTTRFSPAQIEQIRRTVRRTPEVMVSPGVARTPAPLPRISPTLAGGGSLRSRRTRGNGSPERMRSGRFWRIGTSSCLRVSIAVPVTSVLTPGKPSWSIKLCGRCRRRRHRRRCSPQPVRSPGRSSASGTAMPWRCTVSRLTLTSTWS